MTYLEQMVASKTHHPNSNSQLIIKAVAGELSKNLTSLAVVADFSVQEKVRTFN